MEARGKMKKPVSVDTTKFKHPEMKEDEILLGNYFNEAYYRLPYNTKRKGNNCYTINGKQFTIYGYFPVFVRKEDWEAYHEAQKWNFETCEESK